MQTPVPKIIPASRASRPQAFDINLFGPPAADNEIIFKQGVGPFTVATRDGLRVVDRLYSLFAGAMLRAMFTDGEQMHCNGTGHAQPVGESDIDLVLIPCNVTTRYFYVVYAEDWQSADVPFRAFLSQDEAEAFAAGRAIYPFALECVK